MKNQKMFLMVLISLLYVNTSWAEGFKVEKVNGEQTRAIIEVPADTLRTGDSLVMQDDFDVACYASVVSTKSRTAVLDISKCSNRSSVKPGVSFTVSATKRSNEKPLAQKEKPHVGPGPTINEDWYTLWGLGFSSVNYGDDSVNQAFDDADSRAGVTHTTINTDLFGFYWPTDDHLSMHGFIINGVGETITNDSTLDSVSVYNYLYAYSFHHFFGANIGDQWFVRADVGLAKYLIHVDIGTSLDETATSDWGWGALVGGGYGFALGSQTRFLLGVYVSRRKVEDEALTDLNLTGGFLF